jgi:isopenicillin-N epimerase
MNQGPASTRFGRAIRHEWLLDPGLAYLNHGTVGVTPRAVLDAQRAIGDEIEANPSPKLLREVAARVGKRVPGRIRAAIESIAPFVGARAEDLVFVDNTTSGANAVLRSFDLRPGDAVLITGTTYGGVRQAVRYACRRAGADVVVAPMPSPIGGPEEVLAAIEQAITPAVRLAVLDHIVSETGVVLPIRELVARCHARGVRVLVDGAHVPGQLPLEIPAIAADWYVANLHKWAFAPRSCGILWATPDARQDLHPPVISWGLDEGFTAEFDWTGTRDPSAWLAAPAGLEFLRRLGFEALREYNHTLVWRAATMLCERWGGRPVAPEAMTPFMSAVPLPDAFEVSEEAATRLRDALLFQHSIEVPVHARHGRLWLRLSAQVYNEMDEFERLALAVETELEKSAPVRAARTE